MAEVCESVECRQLLEEILDKIAIALIESSGIDPNRLQQHQKAIRGGLIQIGRTNSERLVLYEKDIAANQEDLSDSSANTLLAIADQFHTNVVSATNISATVNVTGGTPPEVSAIIVAGGGYTYNVTNYFTSTSDGEIINPLNVSQFIQIQELEETIDPTLAEEYLDTNIFELLPDTTARQKRIDEFFQEFQALTNNPPDFQIEDGMVGDGFSSHTYHHNNDITSPQENDEDSKIEEPDGMITRLDFDANTKNSGKTLESLRNTLNTYLIDIDEQPPEAGDLRPTYTNKSDGYLKFRQLNQGIIIRNTNQEYIEGLNPDTQDYLNTGFTITMWVRFLDKVSEGTLFNFGNPLRGDDTAFGFKLETYVVNKESLVDHATHNNFEDLVEANGYLKNTLGLFSDTNSERFVRLVVNDNGTLRDSVTGNPTLEKLTTIPDINGGSDGVYGSADYRVVSTTKIPQNFNEWYFICATFSNAVDEDHSYDSETGLAFDKDSDFWNGNKNLDGTYTHHSGYGNKCKVEIISRTDLLRARGYKV